MHPERTEIRGRLRVIVGAAIIAGGRVLACERSDPPEVAGKWEFAGGKVEPGETEVEALIRECDEELGV
ncbi:MAG TPA: NUDIX domain-containing protein, partial [Micromonosporaceae bacterium]